MNAKEAQGFLDELLKKYPCKATQKTWAVGNIPMADFVVLEPMIRDAMKVLNRHYVANPKVSTGFYGGTTLSYAKRLRIIFNGPRRRVDKRYMRFEQFTRRAEALYACVYIGSRSVKVK